VNAANCFRLISKFLGGQKPTFIGQQNPKIPDVG
jgi:hypothetical protein